MKLTGCLFFIVYSFFWLVIVTAEEIPVITITAGKSKKSLNSIGTFTEIIKLNEVSESGLFSVGEIISKYITNTNSFQSGGGFGGNTGIQIRGLEKKYSTVYIDGVKMMDPSSPDGSFYLDNLLSGGIDRIEILKGSQSVLYGNNAIGGTINIFTKKGNSEKKNKIILNTSLNNEKNFNFSHGNETKKTNYYFNFNRLSSKSISAMNDNREKDKYENNSFVTNLSYKIDDKFMIENSNRISDSFYNYDEILSSRSDSNNNTKNLEFSNNFKLIHNYKNFKNIISINKFLTERYTTAYDLKKSNFFGYRDSIYYNGEYNLSLYNKILFGIDSDFESARYTTDAGANDTKQDEELHAGYIDYQFRPHEQVFASIGFRRDYHTTSESKNNLKASAAYVYDNNNILKSSFGTGSRFPSLYDYAYGYSNIADRGGSLKEIKPERGLSYDIGYEKKLPSIDIDLNIIFFKTEIKNAILSNDATSWVSNNASGVNTTKGVEIYGNWQPLNSRVKFSYNYTYNKSFDANTCEFNSCLIKNNKMYDAKVRVPRNSIGSELIYNYNKKLSNNLVFKYVGERRDYGNANNNWNDVILKEYNVFDFKTIYNIKDNSSIILNIKNVFNKNYEQVYQYTSPKRNINLGLEIKY